MLSERLRTTDGCRTIAAGAVALLIADWASTFSNVGLGALNLAFTIGVMLVLPAGVMAIVKASPELRLFATFSVGALVFQIIANGIWEIEFLQNANTALPALGVWTIFLYCALVMSVGAAWVGVRDVLRPRDAFLDYSIVIAAAAAIGVAVVGRHVGGGWTFDALDETVRALLSLAVVVIVGSAAVGRWQSLPVPVGLIGLSLVFDAAGFLWASFFLREGAYTNNRWPTALWATAAMIGLLAALAVIAGFDRPIKFKREAMPGVSPGPLVAAAVLATAVAAAVAVHGALGHDEPSLIAGLGAIAWIGVAGIARTCLALTETRAAYRELDQAHASLERAHVELEQARAESAEVLEERDEVIKTLAQRNVELAAAQTMLNPLLDLANEQSNGQLREQIEQVGETAADFLFGDRSVDVSEES